MRKMTKRIKTIVDKDISIKTDVKDVKILEDIEKSQKDLIKKKIKIEEELETEEKELDNLEENERKRIAKKSCNHFDSEKELFSKYICRYKSVGIEFTPINQQDFQKIKRVIEKIEYDKSEELIDKPIGNLNVGLFLSPIQHYNREKIDEIEKEMSLKYCGNEKGVFIDDLIFRKLVDGLYNHTSRDIEHSKKMMHDFFDYNFSKDKDISKYPELEEVLRKHFLLCPLKKEE